MDYKYIEQLLERYWLGQTTLEEEQILRAFFRQEDVPAELEIYCTMFAAGGQMRCEETLGDDFDARILSMIEDGHPTRTQPVRARTITLRRRLMPLFKAAAVVAITITLGNAAQMSFNDTPTTEGEEINYAGYKDTFSDPAMAYDRVHNALEMVSEGISMAQESTDSTANSKAKAANETMTRE